jgi:DNA repair exonuclease SbcCD nuclease subunit
MAIKLLHTADWQLGKPFSRFDGDIGAMLREARLAAVERIAEIARDADVAVVLVAGDVLESEHAEPGLLRRMVHRMAAFDGPWLLLPGNHDPARAGGVWDRFKQSGDCPANVQVLTEPTPLSLAGGQLVVLPAPLTQKHIAGDPTAWFEAADLPAGCVKVGMAHGSVAELLADQAESPNRIPRQRAEQAGLDYLALGDWHSVLQVGTRCWYSGSPEPDDFTRSGLGEVLLISIDGPGGTVRVERVRSGRYVWQALNVEFGDNPDAGAMRDQLEAVVAGLELPGETVLRLTCTGALDLAGHAALDGLLERLAARVRHLEQRMDQLEIAPSDADLTAFASEPFLAEVVDALSASDDPAAPEALRLLHATWRRLDPAGCA